MGGTYSYNAKPKRWGKNCYLNFLAEFRLKNKGLSAKDVVKQGARCWKLLTKEEKEAYRLRRTNSDDYNQVDSDSSSDYESNDQSAEGIRCLKPIPRTSNGYLNYIREFRKLNCHLKPKEVVRKGAQYWRRLPPEEKDYYNKMACRVKGNTGRKSRKQCRSNARFKKTAVFTDKTYLTFVRSYRRKHCSLSPKKLDSKAAKRWCTMKHADRMKYQQENKKAGKKKRQVCKKSKCTTSK